MEKCEAPKPNFPHIAPWWLSYFLVLHNYLDSSFDYMVVTHGSPLQL